MTKSWMDLHSLLQKNIAANRFAGKPMRHFVNWHEKATKGNEIFFTCSLKFQQKLKKKKSKLINEGRQEL